MESLKIALQNELLNRCEKNKAYSMRSFAQSMGIPISTLSSIMSGKRTVSKKNLQKICTHLNLQTAPLDAVTFAGANLTWHDVEMDVFMAISQWYHFAILELLKIHKGNLDAHRISNSLNIKINESKAALERLERLKLIEKKNGRYVDLNKGFASYYDSYNTSDANKALMAQLLEIAKDKIQTVPIAKRDHSSVTMAIATKDLPKAKEMLKKFRREFTEELEKSKPQEVYELTIAFYPLTNGVKP